MKIVSRAYILQNSVSDPQQYTRIRGPAANYNATLHALAEHETRLYLLPDRIVLSFESLCSTWFNSN